MPSFDAENLRAQQKASKLARIYSERLVICALRPHIATKISQTNILPGKQRPMRHGLLAVFDLKQVYR